jgi:membrane protein YqaA with SNARE-associated domain
MKRALGAAVVGAGAGAQAGWWFGKSSKQASEAKDKNEQKEVTHAGSESH